MNDKEQKDENCTQSLITDSFCGRYISYLKVLIIITLLCSLVFLFYRQAVVYNGMYLSDLPVHIWSGVNNQGYSLMYSALGVIFRCTNSYIAIALFESGIVIITFVLAAITISRRFGANSNHAFFISLFLLFLCSVWFPFWGQHLYAKSLITQPWHNITYLGMRLFAIPVFFASLDIVADYRDKFTFTNWLTIALPLFFSTTIKPNLLIDYSFALLIVLIVDFVKDALSAKLCIKRFMRYIYLGSVVFPSLLVLSLQGMLLYGPNDAEAASGIAVVFLQSPFFAEGYIVAFIRVLRDSAFPILYFLFMRKKLSKKDYFAYLLFGVTLIQTIVLQETGPRATHGNFTWGMNCVAYLSFLYLVPCFLINIRHLRRELNSRKEIIFACCGIVLLSLHFLSGIGFFVYSLLGGFYYV